MKLIRQGVFETNSSSSHSLTYVASLEYRSNNKPLTITQQFGTLGYKPVFNDEVWDVKFFGYLQTEELFETPKDKLWYLLSICLDGMDYGNAFSSAFYIWVKGHLENIGIILKEPELDEYYNIYVNCYPPDNAFKSDKFLSPEDLYTYLFDNNIVVRICSYSNEEDY